MDEAAEKFLTGITPDKEKEKELIGIICYHNSGEFNFDFKHLRYLYTYPSINHMLWGQFEPYGELWEAFTEVGSCSEI